MSNSLKLRYSLSPEDFENLANSFPRPLSKKKKEGLIVFSCLALLALATQGITAVAICFILVAIVLILDSYRFPFNPFGTARFMRLKKTPQGSQHLQGEITVDFSTDGIEFKNSNVAWTHPWNEWKSLSISPKGLMFKGGNLLFVPLNAFSGEAKKQFCDLIEKYMSPNSIDGDLQAV